MDAVGLGHVILKVSLGGLTTEDLARVQSVTLLLRTPTGGVVELPVPPERVDRELRTASVIHQLAVRGTYRLGCRLNFLGGTFLTARLASPFTATDGMV